MAISGVLTVDLFAGLSATAWTWWMAFGVFFGIVVVWVFTVSFSPFLMARCLLLTRRLARIRCHLPRLLGHRPVR
jgi:hypothetical protein